MGKSYHDTLAEDRRLVVLRTLEAAPQFTLNDSVLHSALERFGHRVSRDVVRADVAWLAELGLTSIERVGDYNIATATERGLEVATGRSTVEGVKRPRPGA